MAKDSRFATAAGRWAAVVARDRTAGGVFYYAVTTTGVYCRPGCSSRLPRRRNVAFFDTCAAAESAGYRPCKRCRPDADAPRTRHARLVEQACRRIEAADGRPSLDALAAAAELSRWHFHRVFRDMVGVTPTQYARACRDRRFRLGLGNAATVTQAIYDAGFGSSSRAYQGMADRLGMTPSAYRDGAAGEAIRFAVARCFLGWVAVAATERGVCAIEFGDGPDRVRERLAERFPKARVDEADGDFAATVKAVVGFIEAPERGLELPLDIRGTAFQRRVWEALREVAPGATVSYADLAVRIGNPKAVRAVARACAANRIAVAVPCHRVVRSDGALGGYRWGLARKRTLLDRESRAPMSVTSRSPWAARWRWRDS